MVANATPADELNACLKASELWTQVKTFSLTTNMRVHLSGDTSVDQFADQLLTLGNGKAPVDPQTGLITFPADFCTVVSSVQDLQMKVFSNILNNFHSYPWL